MIAAWVGIPRSGGFLLPSHPQPCNARLRLPRWARVRQRAQPRARAWARRIALLKTGGEEASLLPPPNTSPPLPKREGRRASVFEGVRCTRTYYMGRPGGRCGSCGTVGPRAGAWQGCERARFAPALPLFSALQRVRALVGVWRLRFCDDGTPMGHGRAPCRGLGSQSFRCGIF